MAVPLNDVPVNVPVNKRQQWFLEQLKQGFQCKPANIVVKWKVVEKTAKRDIRDLQTKRLVKFVGAPKTGGYYVTN
jgi:DeoR/GlpR family transcriptional regulator of sugar metabolism